MDIDFIIRFIPAFVKAALLTLELSFYGIFFSILIGLFYALMVFLNIHFVSKIYRVYIEFSRNTPLLIQLFFLYNGLVKLGIDLSAFTCGVIGLSFLGGSYMAESFRAGLESVKKQQYEAGAALGLTPFQNFRFIILPQALAVAMPSISANIIFLFKETSVVTIIALPDLVHTMTSIQAITSKTNELLLMLFISYLCIILPLSLILNRFEKRLAHV
ncbi:polar amino acid ABC transporter permease [Helicobacter monodelphidis]|uniref:amino acid ABC transporter permease n=1 Tax=Helicobacter sp. 15-1451 TaxID=2004995 RepID=UPI000DCB7DCB|nr:amino acid ABC transporter permease [Helicobacter sp. 15-1451]RAX58348.1 polar amino acid ABC transporter permease [Helicobacter sp. 15-1451]